MDPRLRAGIGVSDDVDGLVAGRVAAAEALAELGPEPPALVVVYASSRYDLADLLTGVREVTGETRVVGATSAGMFACGVVTPARRGVGVLAITAGPYRFGVADVDLREHGDLRSAGIALARAARSAVGAPLRQHAALMLLSDGLAGDQQALLAGLHSVLGAGIPVVGGSAGDDRSMRRIRVLHDDRVLTSSAVAVWIDSAQPLTVTWSHGWRPLGLPRMVTRVDGMTVSEIGGRPAMEVVLEEVLGPGADVSPEKVRKVLGDHPVGLLQPDGSHLVRICGARADGQLSTFTPFPLYAPVQVLTATPEDLLDVSESVVTGALDGRAPGVLLGFSCAARTDILGDRIAEEAERMQAAAGAVPTFGFYTYGEFARSTSVAGYHNASLAALAL